MLALAAFCFPDPAGAVTIDTFPVEPGAPAGSHSPLYITASPLGTLWFTEYRTAVREMNTSGAPLAVITSANEVVPTGDLVFGPDGTLYWAAQPGGAGGFGLRRPNGELNSRIEENTFQSTTVAIDGAGLPVFGGDTPSIGSRSYGYCNPGGTCANITTTPPTDLVLGAEKALWVVAEESNEVARPEVFSAGISGLIVELPAGTNPTRAALGPEGDLWVAARGSSKVENQIMRLTPGGLHSSFPLPPGREPQDIVLGPDGALWFTEFGSNSIGRMTTSGEYSSCRLPNAAANPRPYGITVGLEGAIWFTEKSAGAIGRLTGGNCVPVISTGGGGGGSGGGGVNGGGDRGGSAAAKPALSGLALTPTSFVAASTGGPVPPTRLKLKKGVGTTVAFDASVVGKVSFTVERTTKGRRVGGRCIGATKENAAKPSCQRLAPLKGSFEVTAAAGQNSIRFSGRLSGKALAQSRYLLVATETAAGATSAPASAGFTIAR